MKRIKESIKVLWWAIKLAYHISPRIFMFWLIFSSVLAVLPSIALTYNRKAVSILTEFVLSGQGTFTDILPSLLILGMLLLLIGLSRRINSGFLYVTMYDDYYFGMQEHLMDSIQRVDIKKLMDKEFFEDYRYCTDRSGSLTDIMSCGCIVIMKSISAITMIAVAFSVSAAIGLIAAVCFAASVVMNFQLSSKLVWNKSNSALTRSKQYSDEIKQPGIAKEIRIYQNKERLLSQWKEAYQEFQIYDIHFETSGLRLATVVSGFLYIATFLMLTLSVYQVMLGKQSVDIFLMLYLLGENLSEANKVFSSAFFEALRGFHALRAQYSFLTRVPMQEEHRLDMQALQGEISSRTQGTDTVFEARNLSFSYDGKNKVLKDLNFQIKEGETIALVGSNGSGKSTLVKLLVQLHQPDSGELLFYGKDYKEYPQGSINQRIGMFFQNFYLYHLSLRENVGFGNLKHLKEDTMILDAIEKGGSKGVYEKCKNGLEQLLQRNVIRTGLNLSGGEKQRVAVSRTHMSDKDILIFDEPAAALDPIAEMEQFYNIKEKAKGKTSILISHRVGFARMADRILVLDHGKLVENGTHQELMERKGIYANFFSEQAKWYQA